MTNKIIAVVVLISASLQAYAQAEIDTVLNRWHRAAAKADANAFFSAMADNAVYISTDASERWTKSEFYSFAKPYFDKGRAWDFKPYDRDIHLAKNGKYVWFSELLNTWMGVCRGSGVLERKGKCWRITQYHLSVTVPNDLVKDFITLVDNFNHQKK